MSYKPLVAVTIGDPAGIGPEIVCKTLQEASVYSLCRPLVIGSIEPLRLSLNILHSSLKLNEIDSPEMGKYQLGEIDFINIPLDYDFQPGVLSSENGAASIRYMEKAYDYIKTGKLNLTVSAPANKEAMKMAGSPFTGATELFAHLGGVERAKTVIRQGGCYFFQVTTHMSLREALCSLDQELIFSSIVSAYELLRQWGIKEPVLALSGVNPHAGEGGLLGFEEIEILIPAMERAKALGIHIQGPVPADAIFIKAYAGACDAALLMFHDTANIPIKLVSNEKPAAVITAGLPFIRTTVAHGTAYDIAYQGTAGHTQFKTALLSAAEIGGRIG